MIGGILGKYSADQDANAVEVVRAEAWEQYGWLRHGFSTRIGGVSAVYGGDSLNLGWTKEDDPVSVAENRRRFVGAAHGEMAGKSGFSLVTVRQRRTPSRQAANTGRQGRSRGRWPDDEPSWSHAWSWHRGLRTRSGSGR
jgi:hypothetical protein